jgi:hypothetical protein
VAGTGSYAGPPDLGGVPRHNAPTSAAPSATAPNDNSDSGGDGTDNVAGGGNNTAGGALPDAGQDLSGLLVLSVMLVVGGVAALLVARNRPRRRPAAGSF